MRYMELILIAIGLAMDAFAISICKGLASRQKSAVNGVIAGTYFGLAQAIMPLLGYLIGQQFIRVVENIDHWIIFLILGYIGVNMIKEASSCELVEANFGFKSMFPLAIATSIDALATGITLSLLNVSIYMAIAFIGGITFLLSFIGVYMGTMLGEKFKMRAEIFGGIVLIFLGIKILLEHLGFL